MQKRSLRSPLGWGKTSRQTNHEITGDIFIKISNKTVMRLIQRQEETIGYSFIENHNSESLELKRGQKIGLVTSCVVTQAEQGQIPEERKEDTQGVTGRSNDTDPRIGGASERMQRKQVGKQAVYSL